MSAVTAYPQTMFNPWIYLVFIQRKAMDAFHIEMEDEHEASLWTQSLS